MEFSKGFPVINDQEKREIHSLFYISEESLDDLITVHKVALQQPIMKFNKIKFERLTKRLSMLKALKKNMEEFPEFYEEK